MTSLPSAIVSPEMEAVTPDSTVNTRLWLVPKIVRHAALGPVIVKFLVMSRALFTVMDTGVPHVKLKLIVSPELAFWTAQRSEFVSDWLSVVSLTVSVAPETGPDIARTINTSTP
jgi:hypothetical protein